MCRVFLFFLMLVLVPVFGEADAGDISKKPGSWGYNEFADECTSCSGSGFTPSFAFFSERLEGIWAAPECAKAEELFFHRGVFSLWEGSGQVCLEILHVTKDYGDVVSFGATSSEGVMKALKNGGLVIGGVNLAQLDEERASLKGMRLSLLGVQYESRYRSCDAVPAGRALILPSALSVIDDLNHLVKKCVMGDDNVPLSRNPSCQKAVFDLVDKDGSGALNREEIEEAAYGVFLAEKMTRECADSESFKRNVMEHVMLIAESALRNLDADQSYNLSFDELKKFKEYVVLPRHLDKVFQSFYDLFPFLKTHHVDHLSDLLKKKKEQN